MTKSSIWMPFAQSFRNLRNDVSGLIALHMADSRSNAVQRPPAPIWLICRSASRNLMMDGCLRSSTVKSSHDGLDLTAMSDIKSWRGEREDLDEGY